MACGCGNRKRAGTPRSATRGGERRSAHDAIAAGAAAAGSQTYHEVLIDGRSTGRRFTSLIAAQRYAAQRGDGATVRAVT